MTEKKAEQKTEVKVAPVVKTMRETDPNKFKALQLIRLTSRLQKRASYKKSGHKLGSGNRTCKRCGLKAMTQLAEGQCEKVKKS